MPGDRSKTLSLQARQARLAWAFLVPTIAIVLIVGLYPLLQTFFLSVTDKRLGGMGDAEWVGLENYRHLLGDAKFRAAVVNTVVFTLSSVFFELLIGLGVALIVHSQFKARGVVRAAMLVPWALPTVVSARMWSYMFVDTYGVVNDLLTTRLGLLDRKIAWLSEPGLALASVVAVDVWKTTPFAALLLLAGLQIIPGELYEAAQVDGASRWKSFRTITLPLLKPAILVTLIFRTLDALRVFDVIWVMTGGASGTESMATFNYRELISFQKLGYGSAVSVTIFVIIGVFVALYVRLLRVEEN